VSSNIKDVARLANVSITTVSRVINNGEHIKPETRERVLAAIEKLNFKPNKLAQSLGSGCFQAIGVVATRTSYQAFGNPYFSMVLQAIGETAENKNYEIMLCSSSDENREIEKCMSMIESKVVQGLLLLGSRVNDRLVEELERVGFPFVLVGRVIDEELAKNIYSVDTDNLKDCMEAVEYLISLGHRRIGCIHAPLKYVASKDRLDGYIEAHKRALIPVDYSLIEDGGYSSNNAYEAALKLLNSPNPPTAIFATDDIKAIGAYKAMIELGIKIPDQISLIGHNNYEISQIITPSLTTIDVPIYSLGTTSTRVLFDLIEGNTPEKRIILETSFIKRDSCKAI